MQGQWNAGPNNTGGYGGMSGNPWNNRNGNSNWGNLGEFQQNYRDTVQALQQLQQQMGKEDPITARDIQGAIRDLRQFDPFANSNDPLLIERIQAALAGVEQVEMELRRKVDESGGGGTVRSPGGQKVPQGWEGAAAEYFRKLSKSK
jgi:hypothetical protein